MNNIASIAVTTGDPLGIGGEISIKAWKQKNDASLHPFFVVGDLDWLKETSENCGLDVNLQAITSPSEAAACFKEALPVLPITGITGSIKSNPVKYTLRSIEMAVEYCQNGQSSAVVTNPIHKKRLYETGFIHPGHTEYLADLTKSQSKPVMMFSCSELNVVPLTIHKPLSTVPESISESLLMETVTTIVSDFKSRFANSSPIVVVSGLNPHAGEGGTIGDEEISVIEPTIQKLRALGIDISGPFPGDSLFHAAAREKYDIAICMYHDQALIPIKTIDFDSSVNITLGLPIIRTSPDHGTADDIAGQGIASASSLIAAIKMAAEMAQNAQSG